MSCHYSYRLLYNDKSSAFNRGNTEQPTALLISMFPQSRSNSDITRDDSQRRFLAQDSVGSLLRHCFEWLQHCSNIVTLCCAKTRRCESLRVTSPEHKNLTPFVLKKKMTRSSCSFQKAMSFPKIYFLQTESDSAEDPKC